jgi:TPR repeat protein
MKVLFYTLVLVSLSAFHSAFGLAVIVADLQARVAKGDAEAELELGRAYHQGGHGVPIDFAKALDLYRKAAAQGNAKAMYNLGYMYHHGQGVVQDDATAEPWFQKAADKGLPAAEFQMGYAYFNGTEGCKQDYKQALKYLTLAAQSSDKAGQSARAAGMLGFIYEQGLGTPLNNQQAVFWYTLGAEGGDAKAQSNLGRIYLNGVMAKKDLVQAYKWIKLAAVQGEPLATHLYGEYVAAKAFTPEEMAEGDKQVNDFRLHHHQSAVGQLPMVADPAAVKPFSGTNAAGAKPPAGN